MIIYLCSHLYLALYTQTHTHHVLPLEVFSDAEGNTGLLSLDNERTAVCGMLRTDPFAFFPPLNSATRDL